MKESGPKVLNKSKISPVAAEEEKVRISAIGITSTGNLDHSRSGLTRVQSPSRAPEARSMPTATIRPTKVGKISKITLIPSAAPSINVS